MHADLRRVPATARRSSSAKALSPLARLVAGRPLYASLYALGSIDRIDAVKAGVPAQVLATLADDMQITRDQLFGWAGIPRATANRKISQAALLSQDESERVLGIARLIGLVEQTVAESGEVDEFDAAVWTAGWLSEPLTALGSRKPGEFLDTADGRDLVAGLIGQMQSGAYA